MKRHEQKAKAVKAYIDKNFKKPLKMYKIAIDFDIDEKLLREAFRYLFSTTPKDYFYDLKMEAIIDIIKENSDTGLTLSYVIAKELGFDSTSHLYIFIKRRTGMKFTDFCESIISKIELN